MNRLFSIIFLIVSIVTTSCNSKLAENTAVPDYKSENLIITKIAERVYEHTSYLETEDFGRVASNGPGHGELGGQQLLTYTDDLFSDY